MGNPPSRRCLAEAGGLSPGTEAASPRPSADQEDRAETPSGRRPDPAKCAGRGAFPPSGTSGGCFPASPLRVCKTLPPLPQRVGSPCKGGTPSQRPVPATGRKGASSTANPVLAFALGLLAPLRLPVSSSAPARPGRACPPPSLPPAWLRGASRGQRPPERAAAGPTAGRGSPSRVPGRGTVPGLRPGAQRGSAPAARGRGRETSRSQASRDPPGLGTERPGRPSRHICRWGDHRQASICRLAASLRTSPDLRLPPQAGGPAPRRVQRGGRSPACCPLPPGPAGLGVPRPGGVHRGRRPPPPPGLSPVTTGRSRETGAGAGGGRCCRGREPNKSLSQFPP